MIGETGLARGPRIDARELFIAPNATIGDALTCIDRSGRYTIALVVDADEKLINTVSDGDVRRGLLHGLNLADGVAELFPIKSNTPRPFPVTAPVETDDSTLLELMRARAVRQIPLLDADGRVRGIVAVSDLIPEAPRALQALIMAGGEGRRLRPLTEQTPKPMLPVGGKPLMELIVGQLRDVGITRINVATHYQSNKIIDHFRDGAGFGVDISYLREQVALGTGGALGLMTPPQETVLVINGDILTDIDFRSMHAFHIDNKAAMTVAVRQYEIQVPYGVIDCAGSKLVGIREKPKLSFFVNAGIYMLEPQVYAYIPPNQHLHMTELIERLLDSGEAVASFPVREYWLDIGQHADYERAQAERGNGPAR